MAAPVVSVVVVNYNGGRHLNECLTALYENSDVPFEAIVVDNASTDGSIAGLVERYAGLRLIANPENVGYSRGVNLGLAEARGEYLVVLNMDIIVGQNWLSPLVDFLEAHPQAGAAAPRIMLYERPDVINALGQNVHVTGLGFNRRLNWPEDQVDRAPVQVGGVQGGAFAVRTDVFRALGGMNEAYFLYHEDVEISLRLGLAGYAIFAVPNSVVYHKYDLHMTPEKLHWLERHRWVTVLSTYRTGTLIALAPVLLVTEAMMAGYCMTRGLPYVRAKIKAMRWVRQNRDVVQQCRQEMQALRRVTDRALLSQLRWMYDWDQFMVLARQKGGWLYEAVSGLFARRTHDRAA